MSSIQAFTIDPSALKLGGVLARGAPGVTVIKAELKLGNHSVRVRLLAVVAALPGCSQSDT